jgi:sec-independent protein translocase protein TatB
MGFGFSGEMIFLFFLALILFGPKKLPEIGRTIGRFMNEFRRASNEFRSQIETEINSIDNQAGHQTFPSLPSLKAPLGSLASRIFNPPSAEKHDAAEAAEPKPAAVDPAVVKTELAPSPEPAPAPKVAADA